MYSVYFPLFSFNFSCNNGTVKHTKYCIRKLKQYSRSFRILAAGYLKYCNVVATGATVKTVTFRDHNGGEYAVIYSRQSETLIKKKHKKRPASRQLLLHTLCYPAHNTFPRCR